MSETKKSSQDVLAEVTEIIARIAAVTDLGPDQDYYEAGVTSLAVLPIIMEISDRFEVEIPYDAFIEARSPRQISDIIVKFHEK